MTNEEFEKRMEFMIEQQARFSSDIQLLQEAQARTEQALAQTQQTVAQTEQIVARLANVTSVGFKDVTAKIDALVDSQIRLTESQTRTDAKIEALADSQSRTEENLRTLTVKMDALVSVIDRYFRERRNGESSQ